ncbi:assimilatory sulfite reductase (NADPH) flavoprotein subunit [Marinilabilia rubra]|uniref:assimilatory sulfite reductase (NADPH) n=1 Tax=Marinilabilia rubra TaxID=2162893 RepID=A0A2U2B4U2_9BACT|nr:assimilatory sulfite reductase (NADPH) flavoprotein subunit [Marinilabilia rubra]PWD98057.1 assimilatory sulfite reductase (NADPH) flavoprotein subunit [Marinilabilia rubra]
MSINHSPLSEFQIKALGDLTNQVTAEQVIWLNGYFQGLSKGLSEAGSNTKSSAGQASGEKVPLTILFGTHTNRSKKIAESIQEKALSKNFDSKVVGMDDYNPRDLKKEKNLLVVVSTHGEGDPPEMAENFHKFITGKRAPKLPELNFSVLALGDKSYKHFCKTGIEIYQSLRRAGATRFTPIVKCDVDYEDDANQWKKDAFAELEKLKPSSQVSEVKPTASETHESGSYSRKYPFEATILEKVRITGRESDKEIYHLEISLEDSGLTYEPGDALGVIAQNPENLVIGILEALNDEGLETIDTHAGRLTLKNALQHHYEITILTRDIISKYAQQTKNKQVEALLKDEKKLDEYLYGHDVLDLLHEFPTSITPVDLLKILRPLPPRLYSISSSQDAVGEEVHITVSKVQYENKGRQRLGACSGFHLAENLKVDDTILVYIEKNPNFRLPENGTPIIMVGAGTGIAPYRAFLQQRESAKQKGKTWLFFGERHFSSDFLYQTEWQQYLKKGYLQKIDLAFSRDQKEKVYVQHKLKKQQKKLYKWLEDGAVFYLCGDMKHMARDVETTLHKIIEKQGGMTTDKARDYIKKLKKEKRFQADVY